MTKMRLRFAPSPTGALHIGGVRTALYNYLLAKKHNGTFILRIEDTDQKRYVPGAEDYIKEALSWSGLNPTEGPGIGGDHGPYRQSERKPLYKKYAEELLNSGNAYIAFDTAEDLEAMREKMKAENIFPQQYNGKSRMWMKNSLTLSAEEVQKRMDAGEKYTIRLKIPADETVHIKDLIRGDVSFSSNELDDKVVMKSDGMPTYHLANIVDDHLMEISHVIRGEEWLPSTAHHVLMYRFFGWEETMPKFAHLPLILKPNGKGKLSKRDGMKLGIPVFPLAWKGETEEDSFTGFREFGFDPKAVNNFLAFLGWNPGTEQEIFNLEELSEAFSLERIGKAGARFDFDKAKWFNEQYIMAMTNDDLAALLKDKVAEKGYTVSEEYLEAFCGLMKERVTFMPQFLEDGYYFFEPIKTYDQKTIKKKYKAENKEKFDKLISLFETTSFKAQELETSVKAFIEENGLNFGAVFPVLRIALSGTMKGPSLFDMMSLMGRETVIKRMNAALSEFENLVSNNA